MEGGSCLERDRKRAVQSWVMIPEPPALMQGCCLAPRHCRCSLPGRRTRRYTLILLSQHVAQYVARGIPAMPFSLKKTTMNWRVYDDSGNTFRIWLSFVKTTPQI